MKKVIGQIKLQLPAGKANPSPPVGPALGQHGVNIMAFCKEFNSKTHKDKVGKITRDQVKEIAQVKLRIPTRARSRHACRASSAPRVPWGSS